MVVRIELKDLWTTQKPLDIKNEKYWLKLRVLKNKKVCGSKRILQKVCLLIFKNGNQCINGFVFGWCAQLEFLLFG